MAGRKRCLSLDDDAEYHGSNDDEPVSSIKVPMFIIRQLCLEAAEARMGAAATTANPSLGSTGMPFSEFRFLNTVENAYPNLLFALVVWGWTSGERDETRAQTLERVKFVLGFIDACSRGQLAEIEQRFLVHAEEEENNVTTRSLGRYSIAWIQHYLEPRRSNMSRTSAPNLQSPLRFKSDRESQAFARKFAQDMEAVMREAIAKRQWYQENAEARGLPVPPLRDDAGDSGMSDMFSNMYLHGNGSARKRNSHSVTVPDFHSDKNSSNSSNRDNDEGDENDWYVRLAKQRGKYFTTLRRERLSEYDRSAVDAVERAAEERAQRMQKRHELAALERIAEMRRAREYERDLQTRRWNYVIDYHRLRNPGLAQRYPREDPMWRVWPARHELFSVFKNAPSELQEGVVPLWMRGRYESFRARHPIVHL